MHDAGLAWIGLAIIVVATTIWFRRAKAVALTGSRVPFVAAWAAGALAGLVALFGHPGFVGGTVATLALVSGALLLGLVAVSPQAVASNAIRVGERLRDFTAPDEHGQPFTLSQSFGRPILLKFFRGHW